jgi:hypothetical protein
VLSVNTAVRRACARKHNKLEVVHVILIFTIIKSLQHLLLLIFGENQTLSPPQVRNGDYVILGKPYLTGYEPMHDASNHVIGVYYFGYMISGSLTSP